MGLNRFLLPVLSLVAAVSCGGDREKEPDGGDMLQYAPRINEVEVMRLERTDFQWQLLANGRLVASARSALPFRTAGVLTELDVHNGQRVSEGDVLARQDSREKRLALEAAQISFDRAELDLYDNIAGLGYPARDTAGVPADVLAIAKTRSGYSAARNALEKAEFDFEGTVLTAPFSGIVADVAYRRYDMTGSEPLCTLIDDRSFDVDFMVLESEYPNVAVGMDVEVVPFGAGGSKARGKVISVNPVVDRNGQVQVRARLSNDGSFVDGMNVKVTVERPVPDRLVVPKSAVVIRDNQHVLFRYSRGRARWTYINVLMSNSEDYVVEANLDRGAELAEGDTVIVSGNLNIADDSAVVLKAE